MHARSLHVATGDEGAFTSLIPRSTLDGLIETAHRDISTVQMPPIQLEQLLVPQRATQILPKRERSAHAGGQRSSYFIVAIGFAAGIGISLACLV